jgi:hypothetical protein
MTKAVKSVDEKTEKAEVADILVEMSESVDEKVVAANTLAEMSTGC